MHQIGDYITVEGAALELGISKWAVYKRIYRRKLKTTRLGKTHLVNAREVMSSQRP